MMLKNIIITNEGVGHSQTDHISLAGEGRKYEKS
jgi:hypothetical protein